MFTSSSRSKALRNGIRGTALAAGAVGAGASAHAAPPAAIVATDVDGNGLADIAGADVDGDGMLDIVTADLDLDGAADTVAMTGEIAAESAGDLADAGGSVVETLLALLGF
jgi:hypothetical protein